MVRKLNRKLRDRFESERQDREARQRFEDKKEQDRIEREKPKLHAVSLFTVQNDNWLSAMSILSALAGEDYTAHLSPMFRGIIDSIADKEVIENYLKDLSKTEIMLDYMRRKLKYEFNIVGHVSMNTMMNVLKLVDQMAYMEKCNLFTIEDDDYTSIKLVYNNICGQSIFNKGYRHLTNSTIDMEYNSGTPEQLFELSRYIHVNMNNIKQRYRNVAINITRVLEDK